ncbi:uncharacterized protein LOC143620061 [Bidens hawaiensis]|uniref:uncharacterized protein LOC143620061 n=1 Tax=Bidens hawaiensis TaxID=980011 RepID=UPI00404B5DC6
MHATDLGDYIGMESCIDLVNDYTNSSKDAPLNRKPWGLIHKRKPSTPVKEFPPPLPVQTSTVFKRYCTDDGRLIIAEEKIDIPKCHFTAHRSNGRLTLEIIPSESTHVVMEDSKVTVESESDDDGGIVGGGVEECFKYSAAVRVAATGPCSMVEPKQLHAIRPVQI